MELTKQHLQVLRILESETISLKKSGRGDFN